MRHLSVAAACAALLALAGCESTKGIDTSGLKDAGGTAAKALTLSDGDILTMSDQS